MTKYIVKLKIQVFEPNFSDILEDRKLKFAKKYKKKLIKIIIIQLKLFILLDKRQVFKKIVNIHQQK